MERLVHPDQTYGIAKRSIEQNIRTKADGAINLSTTTTGHSDGPPVE